MLRQNYEQANRRFVDVDAARFLLVIYHFAQPITDQVKNLQCMPSRDVSRVFPREYHLQKLDFLVRNPSYLAYEMIELHRLGIADASDPDKVIEHVREVLREGESEQRTDPYRRFWRGAYENVDRVKSWCYSRGIIYTEIEPRGDAGSEARPVTYFFLTPKCEDVAKNLIKQVEPATWYDTRIRLLHSYFKTISPARLKDLQYSLQSYRDAQLEETIPNLPVNQITEHFRHVFGEELEVQRGN